MLGDRAARGRVFWGGLVVFWGLWAALGRSGPGLLVSPGWAAPQDEISRRDYAISGFKPPPRWEVLPRERRSYPQLLAWASRGEGVDRSVITLIGKRLPRGATLKTIGEEAVVLRDYPRAQNVRVQQQFSLGWTSNQRLQLDALLAATKTQRPQVLRQFLYLNTPFAYVLTLVCPQEQAVARYRDLDDTAANLAPLPTIAPAVIPATPPAPPSPPAVPPVSPAGPSGPRQVPPSGAPSVPPHAPSSDAGVSDLR